MFLHTHTHTQGSRMRRGRQKALMRTHSDKKEKKNILRTWVVHSAVVFSADATSAPKESVASVDAKQDCCSQITNG
jgi:hypothetical protein